MISNTSLHTFTFFNTVEQTFLRQHLHHKKYYVFQLFVQFVFLGKWNKDRNKTNT